MSSQALAFKSKTKRKPASFYLSSIAVYAVAVIVLIFFVYPLVNTIIGSLKTYEDFTNTPQYALPTKLYFGNYVEVFKNNFGKYFLNSVLVAFLVVLFTVILSAMASFAISKFKFRRKRLVEIFFLLGLMVPYQVVLLPLYLTYAQLNLLNSYFSLILPQVAFGMPFSIQLFLAFFSEYDDAMIEAAVIEGCGITNAFLKVVVPMCRNIIITIATLRAIFAWNEYIFSYTFVNSKAMMTVVLGLNAFVGEEGVIDWGPTFAAITVTVIPTLIVYMFLGKYMQSGLSEGSVKG